MTAFQNINCDPILTAWPSRGYPGQLPNDYEQLLYHQAIYEVADQYNVALFDLQRRWGYGYGPINYAAVNGVTPTPLYEGTHATLAGYADIGRMISNIVARIA